MLPRSGLIAFLSLLALAACSPETEPKAEPNTGVATVYLDYYGSPVVGVAVVFHRPDGSVLARVQSDAAGLASATIERGALVTVARQPYGTPDEWDLRTVAGVAPLDRLSFQFGYLGTTYDGVTGSAAVTFPGALAGARYYGVEMGCNASGLMTAPDPVDVLLLGSCGSSLDVMATASDLDGGFVGWAVATDVPVTGAAPDQTAAVDLGAWRTDFGEMPVSLVNPPASGLSGYSYLRLRRGTHLYSALAVANASFVSPASAASSIPYQLDFASTARLGVYLRHAGAYSDTGYFIDNEAALAARTIDLSTAIPPRLSGAAIGEVDGRLRVSWTRAAEDPGLDGTVVEARWTDTGGLHDWTIVMPPGPTTFDFPVLPAELDGSRPEPGAIADWLAVTSYDNSSVASYGEFRRGYLSLNTELPNAGPGTMRISGTATVP